MNQTYSVILRLLSYMYQKEYRDIEKKAEETWPSSNFCRVYVFTWLNFQRSEYYFVQISVSSYGLT